MIKYAHQKAILVHEEFDLKDCWKHLENDPKKLQERIEEYHGKMYELRLEMRPYARDNNELEQEVSKLDKRIHSVLQDQCHPGDLKDIEKSECDYTESSSILKNREAYETMFYLLQKNPRYFAVIAPEVKHKDMSEFVNTIIFDMYGDQFDTSEERLLLTLFKTIFKAHFERAGRKGELGTLFRANTAVTTMLSSYARRGEGLNILKKVLEEPLQDMLLSPSLTLEINAFKVYQEVIQSYEKKTHKPWPLERRITTEEAYTFVQDLVNPRIEHLKYIADYFLQRIIDNVEEVPFGMRWLCKQLAELGSKYFPKANRYEIGSIVGSYLFLRFFNPAIVNPDRGNLLNGKKLSRKMRDNLVMIARVLQNQSNGVHFRGIIMECLNEFLDNNREKIQRYFQELIEVDNLEEKLEVDDLLENVKRRKPSLTLKYNQIYLMHRLIWENKDKWDLRMDALMLQSIFQLGEPPKMVDRSQNRSVVLELCQPENVSVPASLPPPETLPILYEPLSSLGRQPTFHQEEDDYDNIDKTPTWESLRDILRVTDYPKEILENNRTSLFSFLTELSSWAKKENTKLVETIKNNMNFMDDAMHILHESERERSYNEFLMEYVNRVRFMVLCEKSSRKKLKSVEEARKTLGEHKEWLQQKKSDYEAYLNSVREQALRSRSKSRGKKKSSVVLKHPELESRGIILAVDPVDKPSVLKKLIYEFKLVSEPDTLAEFEVSVMYSTRVKNVKVQSVNISYKKLKEMQERKENVFKLDSISLSVNLLIKMLDQEFR